MEFLNRYGWPVERIKGRPVVNAIRLLIHTRRIVREWKQPDWVGKPVEGCQQSPPHDGRSKP